MFSCGSLFVRDKTNACQFTGLAAPVTHLAAGRRFPEIRERHIMWIIREARKKFDPDAIVGA